MYLKDGSKATGRLIGKNGKEFRLQSTEGMIFIFDRDSVVKVIPATIPATHKFSDNLSVKELKLYLDKAVKLRNAGRVVTLGRLGLVGGSIIWAALGGLYIEENAFGPLISGFVGSVITFVGLPVWAVGVSRKTKAEFTLQNFSIVPENSMILGVEIKKVLSVN